MKDICWVRYPLLSQFTHERTWLTIQSNLGLSPNTVDAYGRALEDYLTFSSHSNTSIETAKREHIALYVNDLTSRKNPLKLTSIVSASAKTFGKSHIFSNMQENCDVL